MHTTRIIDGASRATAALTPCLAPRENRGESELVEAMGLRSNLHRGLSHCFYDIPSAGVTMNAAKRTAFRAPDGQHRLRLRWSPRERRSAVVPPRSSVAGTKCKRYSSCHEPASWSPVESIGVGALRAVADLGFVRSSTRANARGRSIDCGLPRCWRLAVRHLRFVRSRGFKLGVSRVRDREDAFASASCTRNRPHCCLGCSRPPNSSVSARHVRNCTRSACTGSTHFPIRVTVSDQRPNRAPFGLGN